MELGRHVKATVNQEIGMRITYHESGGFAGLMKGAEIDTTLLNPAEALEVAQLVQQSGIMDSSDWFSSTSRDRLQYEVSIEIDTGVNELRLVGGNGVQQIKPLLQYLKERSHPEDLSHVSPIESVKPVGSISARQKADQGKVIEPINGSDAPAVLEYELPEAILEAYHALVARKFGGSITAEEERELERLGDALDEADSATPLERARAENAGREHERQMSILDNIMRELKALEEII